MAQISLVSSRIVNKKVICKLNSKEAFHKWWHFELALIFYLKYCLSYLENHVLPSSLDLENDIIFKIEYILLFPKLQLFNLKTILFYYDHIQGKIDRMMDKDVDAYISR